MKKKILCVLLTLVVIVSTSSSAIASHWPWRFVRLQIGSTTIYGGRDWYRSSDGELIIVDPEYDTMSGTPYKADGIVYMPIRAPLEAIGVTVSWNDSVKKATVNIHGEILVLTLNSPNFTVDGRTYTATNNSGKKIPALVSSNGMTFIPIETVLGRIYYLKYEIDGGWILIQQCEDVMWESIYLNSDGSLYVS